LARGRCRSTTADSQVLAMSCPSSATYYTLLSLGRFTRELNHIAMAGLRKTTGRRLRRRTIGARAALILWLLLGLSVHHAFARTPESVAATSVHASGHAHHLSRIGEKTCLTITCEHTDEAESCCLGGQCVLALPPDSCSVDQAVRHAQNPGAVPSDFLSHISGLDRPPKWIATESRRPAKTVGAIAVP
jgi:hypothetical protein